MSQPLPNYPDFSYTFTDDGSALIVNYTGPADPQQVDWPSDAEISAAVGLEVKWLDAGDNLLEAIFLVQ